MSPLSDNKQQQQPASGMASPQLIVGIGGSAGGLQAFQEFLAKAPTDSGMGFVLLPHLDPKHNSMMTDLLAQQTSMPVCQAREGQVVEANHVYILPPGCELTIDNGALQLQRLNEPSRTWVAIDRFLRSLAVDQKERAVGIIMSGTGSHGILGLKEIKRAGGLVMVQDPETAEYTQMPANAIASGVVDLVLAPSAMPAALLEYARHSYLQDDMAAEHISEEHINRILAILRSRTKYDFREYRRNMLVRRIQRRMSLCHLDTMEQYQQHLRNHPDEVTALNKDLLISVTAFFRDVEAFHALEQQAIRELIEQNSEAEPLRIWVPGCATGEEAYSLAILLLEGFDSAHKQPNFQIFATDIDEDSLVIARRGEYPETIGVDVSTERLKHYFFKTDNNKYRVSKPLRDSIVFASHNLISDAPFSRMDLISCRNLFIYLQPDLQSKVLQLFHFALRDNGFLLLGPSESIGKRSELFEVVSKKWRIFRRINTGARTLLDIPARGRVPQVVSEDLATLQETRPRTRRASVDVVELARQLLLDDYAPASVLINRHYEVLHFYGATMNYLQLPTGEPTRDLMTLAREGLASYIRIAVHRALHDKQLVIETDAHVKRDGKDVTCTLTVRPIHEPREAEGLLLLSFADKQQVIAAHTKDDDASTRSSSQKELKIIEQLEFEIKATREDLQSTIEELESSNEELKASNEEVMSMNEELQSANEELESSKEELQSMNEEMNTVNTELQCKVEELEKSHDDVSNLLTSTDIATLFLDRGMCIKLFNPPVSDLLNLRKGDIDRSISDFSGKIDTGQLLADARLVLEKLVPVEREIEVKTDSVIRYYLQHIVPYRTTNDRIGGVVVTFVDITDRQKIKAQLETELYQREQRLAAIMSYMAEAIIVIDGDGVMNECNPAAEKMFGYQANEMNGKSIKMLMPPSYYGKYDRRIDSNRKPIPSSVVNERREFFGRHKNGSIFPMELTITEIDHLGLFIGIYRDISKQRQLEKEIANISTREQESIGQELHDTLGQQLTGLTMLATSLKQSLRARNEPESKLLNDIIAQLKLAAEAVRRISHGLAPISIPPDGLQDALAHLAATIGGNGDVQCHFEGDSSVHLQDQDAATQLYRIAQESFNNALKHAQAKNINLKLQNLGDYIELTVTDDGQGCLIDDKSQDGGIGLRVMQYRAKMIGARLGIESIPGGGTAVHCRLPISGKP